MAMSCILIHSYLKGYTTTPSSLNLEPYLQRTKKKETREQGRELTDMWLLPVSMDGGLGK
jgi:hypothetical protein